MFKKIFLFLILFFQAASAQDYSDSLKYIEEAFKKFQYGDVINLSTALLRQGKIPPDSVTKVYTMKAISHFALQEDTLAKYSFMEILKRDSSFYPDTITTSPKILRFFDEVKSEYLGSFKQIPEENQKDSIAVPPPKEIHDNTNAEIIRSSYLRSLLLPGLGHLYIGSAKGWYLMGAAGASLASSVYFLITTNDKKEKYLRENNPDLIPAKYEEYNRDYKLRNISLITLAAIWLYTQIDLLFIEDITILPSNNFTALSFRIPL